MKPILDACCGGKMFYFDKSDKRVLFQDIRKIKTTLCDGRIFEFNVILLICHTKTVLFLWLCLTHLI